MIRLSMRLAMTWTPGHNVFLRVPSLGLLDNHPFTIASEKCPMRDERPVMS